MKIVVSLLLTGEKSKATFDSRLRISVEEADGAFENRLREGNFDDENLFSEADSPLEIQINLSHRL